MNKNQSTKYWQDVIVKRKGRSLHKSSKEKSVLITSWNLKLAPSHLYTSPDFYLITLISSHLMHIASLPQALDRLLRSIHRITLWWQRLNIPDHVRIFLNATITAEEAHSADTRDTLCDPLVLVLVGFID